jgi:hypothetical protein
VSISFRSDQYIKVLDTGEAYHGATFTVDEAQEIGHVRLVLYKHGTHAGTERLRVKLYHASDLTKLYATSEWSDLADISSLGANWIGWLRFDFDREWLSPSETYYLAVETTGYTRNADTFYLGFALDRSFSSHGTSEALAFELFSYLERSAS